MISLMGLRMYGVLPPLDVSRRRNLVYILCILRKGEIGRSNVIVFISNKRKIKGEQIYESSCILNSIKLWKI
jgi:hypothetical protein